MPTVASLKNKYPAICAYLESTSARAGEVDQQVLQNLSLQQAEELFDAVSRRICIANSPQTIREAFTVQLHNVQLLAQVDAAVGQLVRNLLTDTNAFALRAAVKTEYVLSHLDQPWRDELKKKKVDLSEATAETIKAFNDWVRDSGKIVLPLDFPKINEQISALAGQKAKQLQAFSDQTDSPLAAEVMIPLAADNVSPNFAAAALKTVQAYKLLTDLMGLVKNPARYNNAPILESFSQGLEKNATQYMAALIALPQLPTDAQAALNLLLVDGKDTNVGVALKNFGIGSNDKIVSELVAEAAAKKLFSAQQLYDRMLAALQPTHSGLRIYLGLDAQKQNIIHYLQNNLIHPDRLQVVIDQLKAANDLSDLRAALQPLIGANTDATENWSDDSLQLVLGEIRYDSLLEKPELKPVGDPDPVSPRPALFKGLSDNSGKIKANLAGDLNLQSTVLFDPASSFDKVKDALIAMAIPDRAAAPVPAEGQPDDAVSLAGKVVAENVLLAAVGLIGVRSEIKDFFNHPKIKPLITKRLAAFAESKSDQNLFTLVQGTLQELQDSKKTENQIKEIVSGLLNIQPNQLDAYPQAAVAVKAIYAANKGYTLEGGNNVAPELIKWLKQTASPEHRLQLLRKAATWNYHDWEDRLGLLMSELAALNIDEARGLNKARAILHDSLFTDSVADATVRCLVGEARLVTYLQKNAPEFSKLLKKNPVWWEKAATLLGNSATEPDAEKVVNRVISAIANGNMNSLDDINGAIGTLTGGNAALTPEQAHKVWAECFLKENESINPSLVLWLRAHPERWAKVIEKLTTPDAAGAYLTSEAARNWLHGLNVALVDAGNNPAAHYAILAQQLFGQGFVLSNKAPVGDMRCLSAVEIELIKNDAEADYHLTPEGANEPNYNKFHNAINAKCCDLEKMQRENIEAALPNMSDYLNQLQKIAEAVLAGDDVQKQSTVQVREKLNRVKFAMELMRDHWLKSIAEYKELLARHLDTIAQINKVFADEENTARNKLQDKSKDLSANIKKCEELVNATNVEIDKYNERLIDVQEKLNAGPAGTQAISKVKNIHYMSDPIAYGLDASGNFNIPDAAMAAFNVELQKRREEEADKVRGVDVGLPGKEAAKRIDAKEQIEHLAVGQALALGADLTGKDYLTVLGRPDAHHFHLMNKQRPSSWTGYPGYREAIRLDVQYILMCSDALHAKGKDSTITINDKDAKYVADILEELELQKLIRHSNGERSNIRVKSNINNATLLKQVANKAESRFKAVDKEEKAQIARMEKLAGQVIDQDYKRPKP